MTTKLYVIKKVASSASATVVHTGQHPRWVAHKAVVLPPKLELTTFQCQNCQYWIDAASGYLFFKDDIQHGKIEPIGQLIERPPQVSAACGGGDGEDSYPVANRHIDWFLRYELDVFVD